MGSYREAHAAQCRCSIGTDTHLKEEERVDRQRSKKGTESTGEDKETGG